MDYLEILKSIGSLVSYFSEKNQNNRLEVAKHFKNLSKTFNEFPIAYSKNDISEMQRLAAKTRGLLDSLRRSNVFIDFLGDESENFFRMIEEISEVKDLLNNNADSAEKLKIIIKAAGYFDGYYETLSAAIK